MDDLTDRLRRIEDNPSPDLWMEITHRQPPSGQPGPGRGPRHRVAAGLVAAIIALVAFAFAWRIWSSAVQGPSGVTPTQTTSPSVATNSLKGTIAFTPGPAGEPTPAIYVLSLVGGVPQKIAEGERPSLSPDGRQIAFLAHPDGGPQGLWVVNVDGSDLRLVAEIPAGPNGAGAPAWSPDARTIVIVTYEGLRLVDVRSGSLSILTSNDHGNLACYDMQPSWSPDGGSIAFAVECDGGALGIWTVRPDGTGSTKILGVGDRFDAAEYPEWAPDGSRLLFLGVVAAPDHAGGYTYSLYTMMPDGSGITPLTDPNTFVLDQASWSPDGSTVVFADGHVDRLYTIPAAGGDAIPVDTGDISACCPTWSR
jgi:prepilin-type processing-associated H-X9-DG protein